MLRGFETGNIFTAAYHAQQFANDQMEMAYAAIQEREKREYEKKYTKVRTKLEDVHAAYSKEKAKRQEMVKALNVFKTKQKEIYRKYEQVCGQKRRLEQMYSEMITFWEWATVAAVTFPVLLGLFDEWNHERSKRISTAGKRRRA